MSMSQDIPDYYRHLTEKKPSRKPPAPSKPKPPGQGRPTPAGPPQPPPPQTFRAQSFTLQLGEDWRDRTVYILAGPASDGIQHNITVTIDPEVPEMTLVDFADLNTQNLEDELRGCRLLLKEPVQLDSGQPAYRAIFVWWPMEDLRLYQEHLYVLHGTTGYVLTASFTKKTRKTLGPQVERMMRSFQPIA